MGVYIYLVWICSNRQQSWYSRVYLMVINNGKYKNGKEYIGVLI